MTKQNYRSQGHEGTEGWKDKLWKGSDIQTDPEVQGTNELWVLLMEEVWSSQGSERAVAQLGNQGRQEQPVGQTGTCEATYIETLCTEKTPRAKVKLAYCRELPFYSSGLKAGTSVSTPKAKETSRKGKWKECNGQVMSRNAAPNCLHDMMWLLHLGAHSSCGFYIKTCTKSSQSMSKQESSDCYTTTSSWGIISSYWQLMVSGASLSVWPLLIPMPFLMEGSHLCACRQY